ncbi:MAG: restriction endonuclease [Bdellovibrionaceae bacterium]|nr:restriction endonuclease [Pseudobdellovibrionaceae bacterium]
MFLFILRFVNKDSADQRALNAYLKKPLSNEEIGTAYERYIGHLYEMKGYDVVYNGAVNGFADFGRDLIVKTADEIFIIQTKCWAKYKQIKEKEIFQLFDSMTHFRLTSNRLGPPIKAVFYTSASYSDEAKEAAQVLGVELRNEKLIQTYPMIKCNVSMNGSKYYHLPFDPYYDKVKINQGEECYVHTVAEAVAKGFRRAGTRL